MWQTSEMFWGHSRMWMAWLLFVYSWWQPAGPPGQQCPMFAPLLLGTMQCQQYSASWYRQQVPLKYQVALGRQEEVMFAVTEGLVPLFHRALAFVICLLFLNQRVPPFSLWLFEDSKSPLLFSVLKKGYVWKVNNPKKMWGSWTDLKRSHLEWNKWMPAPKQSREDDIFTLRKICYHPKKLCDMHRTSWCIKCVTPQRCMVCVHRS